MRARSIAIHLSLACTICVTAIPAWSDERGSTSLAPAPDATYLDELIARANRLDLAEDPMWLSLLHYEKGRILPSARSYAKTPSFFLSQRGDRDPGAELEATLAGFFDSATRLEDEEPAQCAFVARRHWLVRRLEIDHRRLPLTQCEHYENWRRTLGAVGLTMIFPEGFMNNPASMFGHTLLRLDVDREAGARDVLGYAVDFTADAGGDGALTYVFKGIFGFYPGYFGLNPYYQQLNRYADWENRDIWEYRLEVRDEEVEFLLMHLWELRGVRFPYYFFTKNCSYQLLQLLDIGKPDLHASEGFRLTVVPVDTIRPLVRYPGLVKKVRYRPSPATELRHELRALSRHHRKLAVRVAKGEIDPDDPAVQDLVPAERAALLNVAYDYLHYAFLAGRLEREKSQAVFRSILVARSRLGDELGATSLLDDVPVPSTRPDEGHDSNRLTLAGGWRDGEAYLDLSFRPALHDLMDAEGGYTQHMQIRFLDTRIRYYPGSNRVRLQELVVVEAVSLSPRSRAFRPIAWRLGTGLATRRTPSGNGLRDSAVWRSDIGVGLAFDPIPGANLYGLAGLRLDASPNLERGASFGPGLSAGIYLRTPVDRWKSHLRGEVFYFALGDSTISLQAKLEQRVRLTRNTALHLDVSLNRISDRTWYQAGLGFALHF